MSKLQERQATGQIEVKKYETKPVDEVAGAPQLVEIQVTEKFSGDVEGDGVARFIQVARGDGSATFVGVERVRGSVHGKNGTFLLQESGTLAGKEVKGQWFVVPGSGTGPPTTRCRSSPWTPARGSTTPIAQESCGSELAAVVS